ncbi:MULTISPECIES: fluoride efflux transporter CrcB [Megasphaera]|uniref:Fluoride-specific ion channel FluC n=1 Tax=Megasphaera vaginalis (ex Srinivasan et al. 2021) TaxID=1111454 RepID=U7UL80_9FIRM|nr:MULTISPECIES: fluoride efflux transporter CrcB [Megasphaera]ERT59238.1 protein CrcB [Megasphaera vaginalis (ex Srinivasan et al. 2021)]
MSHILAVAAGGGIGAALRYGVTVLANQHGGLTFPYGTILVNVIGSFLIGVLAVCFACHTELPGWLKLFFITGILGGFTTFSTFNLEWITLIRTENFSAAFLYGGLNVIGSFIFCFFGLVAGESFI